MLLVIIRIRTPSRNTWNDACAWEFRSASGNIPPGLIQNPPTELMCLARLTNGPAESGSTI